MKLEPVVGLEPTVIPVYETGVVAAETTQANGRGCSVTCCGLFGVGEALLASELIPR